MNVWSDLENAKIDIKKIFKTISYRDDFKLYEKKLYKVASALNPVLKNFDNYIFVIPAIYSPLYNKPVFSKRPAWAKKTREKQYNKNYAKLRRDYDRWMEQQGSLSLFEIIFETHNKKNYEPPILILAKGEKNKCENCSNKCCGGYFYIQVGEIIKRIQECSEKRIKNANKIAEIRELFATNFIKAFENCGWCKVKVSDLKKTIKKSWDIDQFHLVMAPFVLFAQLEAKWDYIYYIPASTPGITIGGLIIGWKKEPIDEKEGAILKTLASESLSYPVLLEKETKILRHATRSASVSIMSRNLSHNIGSHVLARLSTAKEVFDIGDKDEKIAGLLSYLRTRMDYIADISTGTQLSGVSLSIYRDVVAPFKPNNSADDESNFGGQRLLLNKICESHDLDFDKIIIKVQKEDTEIKWDNLAEGIDPAIAIPNGLIGAHAVYSIFENILRNSAKHGYKRDGNLEILMRIDTTTKDKNRWRGYDKFYKVTVWDRLNTCVRNKYEGNREEGLEKYLNRNIDSKIIDEETGELKRKLWGIKEMKVSAAYLRRTLLEDIDKGNEPPLLKAIKVNDDGKEIASNKVGNLGYVFYISRPRELLIIHKGYNKKLNKKDRNALMLKGIYFTDSLESSLKEGIDHNFVIIKESSAQIKKNIDLLPVRLIIVTDNENDLKGFQKEKIIVLNQKQYKDLCEKLSKNKCDQVLAGLWERWFNELKGSKGYQLLIREKVQGDWKINGLSLSSDNVEAIAEAIETAKGSCFVLFDRHGDVLRKKKELFSDSHIIYEPYNNTEPIYPFVSFPLPAALIKKRMVYEMLEAGITKVLLIDERIQERLEDERTFGSGETKTKLKVKKMLKFMNIYVPEDINLKNPNKNDITSWLQQNKEDSLFLVIHQGIIDEMGLKRKEAAEKWIEKIKASVPYIVIDSGRGRPPNIVSNARFEHLSGILKYTIETKSKLHLMKLLFSSRRG